jgi:predicted peptidase
MHFRLFIPRNFSKDKRYPLVMCLHGIGERGSDNGMQVNDEYMSHQWMLDSVKSKYQAFVLYPQCPSNDEWTNWSATTNQGYSAPAAVGAVNVIDSLIKVYPIDTTRLYVGGLSWGGMGTEGIMVTYPNKFAAAFPCAGENHIMTPAIFAKTPFWMWHGAKDVTVDPKPDSTLVNSLIAEDTPVVRIFFTYKNVSSTTTTTYQIDTRSITADSVAKRVASGSMYLFSDITNGNHNSAWNLAFFDPSLVPWLMSKSKVNGTSKFTWPAPGPADVTSITPQPATAATVKVDGLKVNGQTIRWNGVAHLPSTISLFTVKGEMVKQVTIRDAAGEMSYAGLPSGVYFAAIGTTRDFQKSATRLTVVSGK